METATVRRGAPASPPPSPTATVDRQALDQLLETLYAGRERWTRTSVPERIALLERVIADIAAAAEDWVADAARAKGLAPDSPAVGEEWQSGPALMARTARLPRD